MVSSDHWLQPREAMLIYLRSGFHAFVRGIGSVLDLSGGVSSLQRPPSDTIALQGDWKAVGNDLRNAIEQTEDSVDEQKSKQLALVFED